MSWHDDMGTGILKSILKGCAIAVAVLGAIGVVVYFLFW